ncbi:DNA phosphorothioation-dependent restriction protein DptG [Limnobaculum parvum]|uniref:DNA phosphorothioation-dependent restriction protein DptG n=1 Tax=Limnobaculum parvum TaxID=2172103 RepID=A0A2Y9U2N1_9GAMM|nr:DNA phosphorothioation-dependent restriction protein DptG [Limnobaculum parvum]AWH90019.1 DNA phosphorothioation-dependent restriction protein DptG [Limnobaculum parvum]
MYPIAEKLIVRRNLLDSYLPVRNGNNDFNWDVVTGFILSHALRLQMKMFDLDQFKEKCEEHFTSQLDEPNFWPVLERMYFTNKDILRVSPLFLLFHAQQFTGSGKSSLGAANWRLSSIFASLMGNFHLQQPIQDQLNFIEQQMLDELKDNLQPFEKNPFIDEQPYLPYLAKCFQDDLTFLSEHPQYLLQELGNTLRLYAFTYCTQLALNLDDWQRGQPRSRGLFFILDTEKASSEREKIKRFGYKVFANNSKRLFPILSMLEVLQWDKEKKRPLWQVYQDTLAYPDQGSVLEKLNEYLNQFIQDRALNPIDKPAMDVESVFRQLQQVAEEQFNTEQSDRADVNRKYIKELENNICSDFIQLRGRAGKVLVLNQDRLLLLTNLTIGKNKKLRLHELLCGFKQRGFYFDNQSTQTLVTFYERMGNVERMSDSGDAVYVRKTI